MTKPKAPDLTKTETPTALWSDGLRARIAEYEAIKDPTLEEQAVLATIRTQLAMVEDDDQPGITDHQVVDPVGG